MTPLNRRCSEAWPKRCCSGPEHYQYLFWYYHYPVQLHLVHLFHHWTGVECREVNKASRSMWSERQLVQWSMASGLWRSHRVGLPICSWLLQQLPSTILHVTFSSELWIVHVTNINSCRQIYYVCATAFCLCLRKVKRLLNIIGYNSDWSLNKCAKQSAFEAFTRRPTCSTRDCLAVTFIAYRLMRVSGDVWA